MVLITLIYFILFMLSQNFIPAFPLTLKELQNRKELRENYKFKQSNSTMTSCIHYLNWINCFIGANNSGKSRTIRALFKTIDSRSGKSVILFNTSTPNKIHNSMSEYLVVSLIINAETLGVNPTQLVHMLKSLLQSSFYTYHNFPTVYSYWEKIELILANPEDLEHEISNIFSTVESISRFYRNYIRGSMNHRFSVSSPDNESARLTTIKQLTPIFQKEIAELISIGKADLMQIKINIPKLYIPIIRGTRPLTSDKSDVYAIRTGNDYKIETKDIFTGLSIYDQLQDYLLGSHDKRRLVKEFEDFLSKSFFNNQEVVLTPIRKDDVVHIKIGDKERAIYDLGDGVQALIVLTFPLFLRKEEEWAIFIEEPEAHLHPKWQRFFISTIKEYFPKHQFFITSHSNVFLNTEDVSVYRVTQDSTDGKTAIEYIDTQHTELLDDLGYKASDLLSANYIIWVEGASDKIYIKQFISAYDDTLIEGIHYSIMFYGGCSNLVKHINISSTLDTDKVNILALNPKCGFIVDSDLESADIDLAVDTDGKDKLAFQQKCTNEGHFCWITKTREIENLIPVAIWKEAAVQYAYTKDNRYDSSMTNSSKVIFDSTVKDINFNDRTGKKKGTLIKMNNNTDLRVNDKIKMAKEVVKLFPKNKADLSSVNELEENIARLVEEIKKANLVEATIEEEETQGR